MKNATRPVPIEDRPRGFRATGVVISNQKLLLMRQVYHGEEFYNLPGGSLERGETLEEACYREVREEFNIDVRVDRLIYILDSLSRLNFVFACEYIDGELQLGGPEGERMSKTDQYFVEWVDLNKISQLNIQPESTKKGLLQYLKNKFQPTFYLNDEQRLNKNVLIVSSSHNQTPPEGYGGIERIAASSYENYQKIGYNPMMVSLQNSKYHDYSFDELLSLKLSPYRLIVSYYYDQEWVNKLNKSGRKVFLILQNNYSEKLEFLPEMNKIKKFVLSPSQQIQYKKALGEKYDIIPNGIDLQRFPLLDQPRDRDIVFIGGLGQHKSPLACLEYAKKYQLGIDFYGPDIFREGEKDYAKKFFKAVEEYPQAQIKGEVGDEEKGNLLNKYKYFIFLPSIDKSEWVEPFGIAPLEALACGCTVITQFDKGGHLSFCNPQNSISYQDAPQQHPPKVNRESILGYNFSKVFKTYYPK